MNFSVLLLTFIAINIDFFIMLIFLLKKYPLFKVMIGYALAVLVLLTLGFLMGEILEKFLPEWLLGILGLLPIYMAFKDDDDDEQAESKHSAIYTVFITYISVCAGCVLSLFIPILVGKSATDFGLAALMAVIMSLIIVVAAKVVENNKLVQGVIEKHGEKLMKICYILIGLYVLFDSGFIEHLIKLI
ncbi:cadmium resistance transporter [Fructilactobacillus vespulae]|uniref:cadmium resistance transporter n=1 Tax=Fructilactobacillus vespulae TaxID=1249630 RepID=UPI0039B5C9C4